MFAVLVLFDGGVLAGAGVILYVYGVVDEGAGLALHHALPSAEPQDVEILDPRMLPHAWE